MKRAFIFLILISSYQLIAQNAKIEVVGEVIDSETREAIPYVHIVNKSLNQGTASNTEGRFWIKINPGDTLLFSAIGFETYQFLINEEITSNKLLITIELSQSTLELENVKVFAYKDENALKRAIMDTKVPLEDEKNSFNIPGIRTTPRAVSGGGLALGGPLSAIGNLFSKEYKELKKLKTVEKEFEAFKNVRSKYNEHVVKELTGLPEDKIEDFMNYCIIDDSYLLKATEYEISVVVNQCLIDYKNQEEK